MVTRGPRPTVYVVDDDDSVRKGLARLLRSEGFAVRAFDSAEKFLDHSPLATGACVVLDINLPRMSGLEVQRRLNERGVRIPIVAVSARDDADTCREAKRLGAKAFFRKPVDASTLVDAIERAVLDEG